MRAHRAITNIAEVLFEGPCDLTFHGTQVGRRFTKANGRDKRQEEKFPSLPAAPARSSRPPHAAGARFQRNWQLARATVAH